MPTFATAGAIDNLGNFGDGIALLGAGDDRFVWDPGNGSDTVMGRTVTDTFAFNGSFANERLTLSATNGPVAFPRDVATVRTNLNEVERFDLRLSGGCDRVEVSDRSGSSVRELTFDLGAGGAPGDWQDTPVLRGTANADAIRVTRAGDAVVVTGLAATTAICGFETGDRLAIEGMGGGDVIDATGPRGSGLVLDGGAGNDRLLGAEGRQILIGGAGTDALSGGPGQDIELQDTPSGWYI